MRQGHDKGFRKKTNEFERSDWAQTAKNGPSIICNLLKSQKTLEFWTMLVLRELKNAGTWSSKLWPTEMNTSKTTSCRYPRVNPNAARVEFEIGRERILIDSLEIEDGTEKRVTASRQEIAALRTLMDKRQCTNARVTSPANNLRDAQAITSVMSDETFTFAALIQPRSVEPGPEFQHLYVQDQYLLLRKQERREQVLGAFQGITSLEVAWECVRVSPAIEGEEGGIIG
ncbi:hypothetical protein LTR62_005386 [Meristemomyces frigidus]|uniref:Uncharacterized protein n=1 Tax=Meristemomyces frigidus TaxID=1508187 RepID=A0AAN7YQV4_9PEZI|nr:hypothetical protein LTR62_005386 [Meristemomyces frigidus]